MQRLNFAIIKLNIFLIIGILVGYYTSISLQLSAVIFTILLSTATISYFFEKKRIKSNIWFGFLIFMATTFLGITIENCHDERLWKRHYTNYQEIDVLKHNTLEMTISSVLKDSKYQDKYIACLNFINNKKIHGKLLLNIDKDSLTPNINVGDVIVTKTNLTSINKPLNPNGFNYSDYLKKQYVYHQLYVSNLDILSGKDTRFSILKLAHNFREKINTKLQEYAFKKDELAIINAMLLGQRKDLSKSLSDTYASAGVIHILAVSGLHVGIILLLLQHLLRPLNYLKKGKTLKIILIVVILWFFAIIAGLSASVVRAVTMFSVVAIGINLKRPTNIFNTLAISMFILLLCKPLFLFSVGFQLSYVAVFAIVWTQPLIYKLWSPKLKLIDYFWQIFTVTIAAQIGVAPLSIFYFNQFPGLFFISNLIIIPFLGVILGLGILIIFLSLLHILPSVVANMYGEMIHYLNSFVRWISEQEAFLFKNISFGFSALLISYIIIIFSIRFFKQKTYKDLAIVLIAVIVVQGSFIYFKKNTLHQFVIFNQSKQSAIAFKENNQLIIHHNLETIKNKLFINDYLVGNNIQQIKEDTLKSVYKINNKHILIIDRLGVYKTSFNIDIVLLRNSPKINLNRLADYLNPELIIADGSNYKSYVTRWKTTCKKLKLPFHATTEKGALTINYTK